MISYLQQFFAVVVELGDRSFVKRLLPTLRLWGHTKDIFDGPELASRNYPCTAFDFSSVHPSFEASRLVEVYQAAQTVLVHAGRSNIVGA